MDVESLGEWIAEQAAHLDAATHRLLSAVREFDSEGGWCKQGAPSCAEWLSWRVGWSNATARDRVRVAKRLGDLPLVDDALRRGELSYCKVRAISRVATEANEAALVEMARSSTGAQLDQICRKYAAVQRQGAVADPRNDADERYVSRRDLDNGFVEISARLHPEEAAAVWAALDRIVKDRLQRGAPQDEATASSPAAKSLGDLGGPNPSFKRADALVDLAQEVLRGDTPSRSPVELVVTIAAATLCDPEAVADPIACLADGTVVSAETARRLACDCGLVMMTEDEAGRPLSVGRKTRSISAAMRRALFRRDQTCRFPGCQRSLFVEGHHMKHWAEGGETSLGNLVTLCSHHHRYVHEYGYRVEMSDDQVPRFFDDRGRPIVDVPIPPSTEQRGWPAIEAQNASLRLAADTPACGWDGEPVDYDWVIDALVSVDRVRDERDERDERDGEPLN